MPDHSFDFSLQVFHVGLAFDVVVTQICGQTSYVPRTHAANITKVHYWVKSREFGSGFFNGGVTLTVRRNERPSTRASHQLEILRKNVCRRWTELPARRCNMYNDKWLAFFTSVVPSPVKYRRHIIDTATVHCRFVRRGKSRAYYYVRVLTSCLETVYGRNTRWSTTIIYPLTM